MMKRAFSKLIKWTWGALTGTFAIYLLFGNYTVTAANRVLTPDMVQHARVSVLGYPTTESYVELEEQDAQVLRDWVATFHREIKRKNLTDANACIYIPRDVQLKIGEQTYFVGWYGSVTLPLVISNEEGYYFTYSEDVNLIRQVDRIMEQYTGRIEHNKYSIYEDIQGAFSSKSQRHGARQSW